jgi:methylated-DNA-[protein]-cysteine S-methyltransferase
MLNSCFYVLLPSAFGTVGLVWQETDQGPQVQRVFLPHEQIVMEELVRTTFAHARRLSCPPIAALGARMQSFLAGEAVDFTLDIVALEKCSAFQQRVLRAEHQIPRRWVSTYQRIARHLGVPGGARAVGGALAHNPFPIIIPCHRAISAHGELGGFQSGLPMKRALLELEGVEFSPAGKALTSRIYY